MIISIPFWSYSNGTRLGLLLNTRYELPLSYKIGTFEPLIICDDDLASSVVNPTELTIKNSNGFAKSCKIYSLVEKRSTISYEYLRIALNDKVYKLNEIEALEDKKYYYFYLSDVELDSNLEDSIKIRIWLSSDIAEVSTNLTLITNIIVR